jgi:iduronate 2-sulfatase
MRKGLLLSAFYLLAAALVSAQPRRPNILFIAVDDLKPEIGAYGSRIARTPHIDRLAAAGTVFLSNYCQQALCGPTRASLLTGMRPDHTEIWNMRVRMRDINPDILTLPQYLASQGYTTLGIAKVFDPRCVDDYNDRPSWTIPYLATDPRYLAPGIRYPAAGKYQSRESHRRADSIAYDAAARSLSRAQINKLVEDHVKPTTEAEDVPDNAYLDGAHVLQMRDRLAELAKDDKPFFMAVGLVRPHLPFVAPKRYWDLYDRSKLPLASFRDAPVNVPAIAMHNASEIRSYTDMPAVIGATPQQAYGLTLPEDKQRELIHGYYAATSYTDANIGVLLDALDSLGLRQNTIVVLWGDHGWHLGDHNLWCKHDNFEQAARAPLIISAPGLKPSRTKALSEFVDVFPTLCELAGVPVPGHLQGRSQVPVMRKPRSRVKDYAVSQYPRTSDKAATQQRAYEQGDVMGYSIRTDRYRYTLWLRGAYRSRRPLETAQVAGVELYDYRRDPKERINAADDASYADVRQRMHGYLVDYLGRYAGREVK